MRATVRQPNAVAGRDVRADRDCGAARPADQRSRGKTVEWKSQALRNSSGARLPPTLIANSYLAGTDIRARFMLPERHATLNSNHITDDTAPEWSSVLANDAQSEVP